MIFFDIETTGLNPMDHSVLTIQVKKGGQFTIWKSWESSERDVLKSFVEFLRSADDAIVGYNINKFDTKFLLFRMLVNGILDEISMGAFKSARWIDLLGFQSNGVRGLNGWADSLGIARPSKVKSWHVPVLYELGMYDEIVEHAREDLEVCEKIAGLLKIGEPHPM
jgi:DNA polymerase elongation subunit (family B)